jgi:hypothetical protein
MGATSFVKVGASETAAPAFAASGFVLCSAVSPSDAAQAIATATMIGQVRFIVLLTGPESA